METVIHHRREFVLYSLRNIEPMKVDMHKLGQSTIFHVHLKDGGFIQALHCDRCAISNHSVAVCHRMSLKSTGGGQLWAKILGTRN